MKKRITCMISIACMLVLSLQIVMAADAYLAGDVDGNGKVEAADALAILEMTVQLEPVQDIADVNADQVVDATDALQVLRMAAALDPCTYITTIELEAGESYVIDGIYDKGTAMWEYEAEETTGITVTKTVEEPQEDIAPGDTPEQIYTISAAESGTYQLLLKCVDISGENGVFEQRLYVVHVN